MSNSKTIYIIHAKDADQHLAKLKEILEDLKRENRIDSYTALKSDSLEKQSFQGLGPADMVIILLTHDLEPDRALIESMLMDLKNKQPDCKIAEVIVDNIPYEPKFIAFPPDLEPIRARENMDAAWNETKNSLKDFFPFRQETKPATPWKKYLPYIIGVIALIILLIFLWPNSNGEVGDDNSGFKVTDLTASVVGSNEFSGDCPHKFEFTSKITTNGAGVVKYTWLRSDNAKGPENTLSFDQAGTKEVKTTWTLGADGENYENFWQKLKVQGPNEIESNEARFTLNCKEPALGNEDCLPFNYQNLSVSPSGSRFVVTDGNSRMMIFDTQEKAQLAINLMKNYQMTAQCFAIRPNPGLRYFKVNGSIPSGSFPGEDCIPLNPDNLTIRKNSNTSYSILSGNSIPYSARSEEEAKRIVEVVQHYKPRFTCYVERPNPGMVYLRK